MNNKSTFSKGMDKVYKNTGYFDKYGGSFVITLITLLSFTLVFTYFWVNSQLAPIRADWENWKHHPSVLPFAGWINAPPGKGKLEFTAENFTGAIYNILSIIVGRFTKPAYFMMVPITKFFNLIMQMVNAIRGIVDYVRSKVMAYIADIMERFINVVTPIHLMAIKMKTLLGKVVGIMVTGLYTAIGSYYALKAFIGAFIQFLILALIILCAVVIILWIFPWTWALAYIGTAVYVAIAIPTIIIAVWMATIIDFKAEDAIPGLCFDSETLIELKEGGVKIKDIKLGDILKDGSIVTTKFKVDRFRENVYNLDGIIISGSHYVYYNNDWIEVDEHPDAKLIENYSKDILYCINTTNKRIKINNHVFLDWDDLTNLDIIKLKNKDYLDMDDNESSIHNKLEGGFISSTRVWLKNGSSKNFGMLKVGDVLKNGSNVLGIVEISPNTIYKYNINNNIFYGRNLLSNDGLNPIKTLKICKLYHIITDTGKFVLNNVEFYDYNTNLEKKLDDFENKPKKI